MAKKVVLGVCTLFVALLCLAIGPLDWFVHGFASEHADIAEVSKKDLGDTVELDDSETFICEFTPEEPHFIGFELYLANEPELKGGRLLLIVRDETGNQLASGDVDLSLSALTSWCHVAVEPPVLREGDRYSLYASAVNCEVAPKLQEIDPDYLREGIGEGGILVGLAYQESTFTLADKAFLIAVIACAWVALCANVLRCKRKGRVFQVAIAICMGALLCWNYSTTILDNGNERFANFQQDSESLATSVMESTIEGNVAKSSAYGLGRIQDVTGNRMAWGKSALTSDDNWTKGYSKAEPKVLVNNNDYTKSVAAEGNTIRFENGDERRIVKAEANDKGLAVTLDGAEVPNGAKLGDIEDAVFLDKSGKELAAGKWNPYGSQFGLQGKVLIRFARLFADYDFAVEAAHLLCAALFAAVLMGIVLLARKKYGTLLAGCFYAVFLLSPWVVDFGNNLYWVAFTWFLPMLVGLACSMRIKSAKARIACYILALISVAAKCLCGYEYITSIMIASVAFLISDAVMALVEKDKAALILCIRAIIGIGCAALLGFFFAIVLHANIRGDGNIMAGMIDIFQNDVLRRTSGGGLDAFAPSLWPSLNASRWEVLLKYFSFPTEIVTGLAGNLFPMLCIAPLVVFLFDARKKQLNWGVVTMYIIFFAVATSWFVLAKSHSYIHVHMSYVLWSFGFIQVCLFVLADKMRRIIRDSRTETPGLLNQATAVDSNTSGSGDSSPG